MPIKSAMEQKNHSRSIGIECTVTRIGLSHHRVGHEFGVFELKHPETLYSACLHMEALAEVQVVLTGHMHATDVAATLSSALLSMFANAEPIGQLRGSRR